MGKKEMNDLAAVSHFVYNCRKCGLCVSKCTAKLPYVCPIKEATGGFEHSSARGKIIIAQGLLEGKIKPSRELAEIIFNCTLCGNCQTQCGSIDNSTGLPLVDTPRVIEAMRADLLQEHPELIDQAYQAMFNSTRQYDNPWGLPRTVKERWTKGLSLKDARKEPHEVLLFTGCTIPSNPALGARARKAALILQKAGVDFAVLGKNEPCCGSVQKRVGALDLAYEMMEKNITLLNSLGSSTIVTLCAGCYHTLKNNYQAGETPFKPKIYHFVEFISQLIKKEKLAFIKKKTLTVTYHDPCHLGRMMRIFDPPREILRALPGIKLVERTAVRENTICCGAGGGMRIFEGGILAEEIGKAALEAAHDAGAEALVTACPFCELNLEVATKNLSPPLAVYDIIDLVSEWSGIEE
jgi:heterodisulfide reductase subunit D